MEVTHLLILGSAYLIGSRFVHGNNRVRVRGAHDLNAVVSVGRVVQRQIQF